MSRNYIAMSLRTEIIFIPAPVQFMRLRKTNENISMSMGNLIFFHVFRSTYYNMDGGEGVHGAASTAPAGGAPKGAYTFQQKPKGVGRGIYRDPAATQLPRSMNIHHDKRVIKGNTYAAQVLPLSAQMELQMAEKEAERQKRRIAAEQKRKKNEEQKRSLTPEPVEGRRHIDIQTDQYLEELTDNIEEATAETQTDPMLDRPPTPKFVPSKSGRDVECQIEASDLFDFDFEVQPILEVMVGQDFRTGYA